MGTVVPYTWTPTRQDLTDPATPATGLWWRDYDHVDDTGTNTVWFPVPLWTALDFGYLPGGQLVVLVAGPHNDGLRSVLRLYRFSGSPDAQTSLGYAELESSEVSGAALGIRAGIVEVFYTQSQILKRKESRDSGETFGSADTYALTGSGAVAFTPAQTTWAIGSGNMAASALGGLVAFSYLPGGSLALVVAGRLAGGFADDNFIVKADRDGAGWAFGTIARIDAGSTRTVVGSIQTLKVGDPLLMPWGKQVRKLKADGTFTLVNTVAALVGAVPAGVSEQTNQMLVMEKQPANSVFRTDSFRFIPATPAWTFVGNSTFTGGEQVTGWEDLQTNGVTITIFHTTAGKVRRRPDGRWEFLYLNLTEQPELVRAPKTPMAGVGTVWS